MTGRNSSKKEKVKRQKEERNGRGTLSFFLFPFSCSRIQRGFTLLELMIVITIIIILAAIALPQYQKTIAAAQEAVLRDDLFKMRSLIDQYAADKGKLPGNLGDLVTAGYMREIPKDPFTDDPWAEITGEDPNSTSGEQGLTDIHSAAPDYKDW
jgi:general secretion pathway protein G